MKNYSELNVKGKIHVHLSHTAVGNAEATVGSSPRHQYLESEVLTKRMGDQHKVYCI